MEEGVRRTAGRGEGGEKGKEEGGIREEGEGGRNKGEEKTKRRRDRCRVR